MNFLSLISIELKKLHRSKILWILIIPVILLWIPSVINADMNFNASAEGSSPENNFMFQSFMGLAWFMYPASIVICSVLLKQTENSNTGFLKMLSLPIIRPVLCLVKFIILLLLAAVQLLMMIIMYYICAALASHIQDYPFILPPLILLKETGLIFLTSVPMAAVYWMLTSCISTPIFSLGISLASIIPSVLAINSRLWFTYPMCYPFMIITSEMHRFAAEPGSFPFKLFPWIFIANIIVIFCLTVSCIRFWQTERR